MTVFNGFANINQYRIAREREKGSWLQREEICLTVMLQVMRAHTALVDAQKDEQLAKKSLELADISLSQSQAKWKEGLATPTEILHMAALRDDASKNYKAAEYRVQVSIAALLHAMGMYGENQNPS